MLVRGYRVAIRWKWFFQITITNENIKLTLKLQGCGEFVIWSWRIMESPNSYVSNERYYCFFRGKQKCFMVRNFKLLPWLSMVGTAKTSLSVIWFFLLTLWAHRKWVSWSKGNMVQGGTILVDLRRECEDRKAVVDYRSFSMVSGVKVALREQAAKKKKKKAQAAESQIWI